MMRMTHWGGGSTVYGPSTTSNGWKSGRSMSLPTSIMYKVISEQSKDSTDQNLIGIGMLNP